LEGLKIIYDKNKNNKKLRNDNNGDKHKAYVMNDEEKMELILD
jgi:hypothetical protein